MQEKHFIQEIERGLYNRSLAWEGKPEQIFDLGGSYGSCTARIGYCAVFPLLKGPD
jgi:hypothetical protein